MLLPPDQTGLNSQTSPFFPKTPPLPSQSPSPPQILNFPKAQLSSQQGKPGRRQVAADRTGPVISQRDFGAHQTPTPRMWWGSPPPRGGLYRAAWGQEQSADPPRDMKGPGPQILGKKKNVQRRAKSCCCVEAHAELTRGVLWVPSHPSKPNSPRSSSARTSFTRR